MSMKQKALTQPSGFYVQKTGKENIKDVDQFVEFNGNETLTCWNGEYANLVTGSDGTQFHPNIHKKDLLTAFVNTASRHVLLSYNGTVHVSSEHIKYVVLTATSNNIYTA